MRTDLLLDTNYDLLFTGGDFATGGSVQQEAELIIQSQMGEWRQHPATGLGIDNYLKRSAGGAPMLANAQQFRRDLKVALEADGIRPQALEVSEDLSTFKIEIKE